MRQKISRLAIAWSLSQQTAFRYRDLGLVYLVIIVLVVFGGWIYKILHAAYPGLHTSMIDQCGQVFTFFFFLIIIRDGDSNQYDYGYHSGPHSKQQVLHAGSAYKQQKHAGGAHEQCS